MLSEVNFHLRPGSFHFLTGPSGAGKTSLLRLLFMSRHPTRGQIHLFNQDVSRISTSKRAQLRRRIGIVFQDFRLLDHLTTWENVALPLRVVGKRIADYKRGCHRSLAVGRPRRPYARLSVRCSRAARSSAPPSRAP